MSKVVILFIAAVIFFSSSATEVFATKMTNDGQVLNMLEERRPQIGVITLSKTYVKSIYNLIQDFIALDQDPFIKGIIVIMENYSSDECIADLILDIKKRKPVIGFVVNSCESAGYKIMSCVDYLVSSNSARIGTIGGIHKPPFTEKSSSNQDKIIISTRSLINDNQRKDMLQKHYNLFLTSLTKHRNLNIEKVSEWAEGKVFTSNQALELNLIDKIGSFKDAIFVAQEKIKERFPEESLSDLPLFILKKQK